MNDAEKLAELVRIRNEARAAANAKRAELIELDIAWNSAILDVMNLANYMDQQGTLTEDLERMTWEITWEPKKETS